MAVEYWLAALLLLLTLSIVFVVGTPIVEKTWEVVYHLNNTNDNVRQIQNRVMQVWPWAIFILIVGAVILSVAGAMKKEYDTAYGGYSEV